MVQMLISQVLKTYPNAQFSGTSVNLYSNNLLSKVKPRMILVVKVLENSFLKRRNFSHSSNKSPAACYWHLKVHKFVQQGCFFFHYFLATLMTHWAQIFTGLLFSAYVGIHQVGYLSLTIRLPSVYLPLKAVDTIGNYSK